MNDIDGAKILGIKCFRATKNLTVQNVVRWSKRKVVQDEMQKAHVLDEGQIVSTTDTLRTIRNTS